MPVAQCTSHVSNGYFIVTFSENVKITNISKTVRDRAISSKFLIHREVQEYPVQRGKNSI